MEDTNNENMNHHTESVLVFNDAKRMGADVFILNMSDFQGSVDEYMAHKDSLKVEEIKGQVFISLRHLKYVSEALARAIDDLEQYT